MKYLILAALALAALWAYITSPAWLPPYGEASGTDDMWDDIDWLGEFA